MAVQLTTSAVEPKVKHSTESIEFGVDFTNILDGGETLTGTPTVTDAAGFLTLSDKEVNDAQFMNDHNVAVAVGCGVLVTIAGGVGTPQTSYTLTVTCTTTAGNIRTVVCILQVSDI